MLFFELGDRDSHDPYGRYPYAQTDLGFRLVEQRCVACERRVCSFPAKTLRVDIEGGCEWPDLITTAGPIGNILIFSQRVVEVLQRAAVTGFKPYPVVIKSIENEQLRHAPRPQYYYFHFLGRIDIDLERSGLGFLSTCPVCGGYSWDSDKPNPQPEKYVPLPDTWDGGDFIRLRNLQTWHNFCSEKVLLLAREHRWTNFRFDTMGSTIRWALQGPGVDYLGPAWPPKWYPDPPYFGKSVREWVEEYWTARGDRQYKALCALEELKKEAIPCLIPLLEWQGEEEVRVELAELLLRWRREGEAVPEESIRKCTAILLSRLDHQQPEYRCEAARSLAYYLSEGVIGLSKEQLQRVRSVLASFKDSWLLSQLPEG